MTEREVRLGPWLRKGGARPLVLGHRGARHAAPENSMKAFELALAEGADGVELDVRLDGDGRVIVLHDRTLERVSKGAETRDVEALGAAELARVDIGDGERAPLLADVLAWSRERRARVNVELKKDVGRPFTLIDGVARAVRNGGRAEELLVFSSFHPGFVSALGLVREHLRLAAGGWTPPSPRTVVLARVGESQGASDDRLMAVLTAVASAVNRDERVRSALRVAVLPSVDAEAVRLLVAGADMANEPGTAGSSAAGARALAFAASGAVMLGTRDGTLRELAGVVGDDNLFLFGLDPLETHAWREGRVYRPQDVYAIDPLVRLALDAGLLRPG